MRLTLRHKYQFAGGEAQAVGTALHGAETWDALRETEGVFGLPRDRHAFLEAANGRSDLAARAKATVDLAHDLGVTSICSYGVGTALLEAHLAAAIDLACTDFTPRTVERLRYLLEVPVVLHDLIRDAPLVADLHLMHRVDCELSDAEWSEVFARYTVPILFIPSELIRWHQVPRRIARRGTVAGWARTQGAMVALWRRSHTWSRIEIAGATAFLLTPRQIPR